MEDDKLVSIVMPIYNAENFLRNNLEALQNQSYPNLEILLINDGSTDRSEKFHRNSV